MSGQEAQTMAPVAMRLSDAACDYLRGHSQAMDLLEAIWVETAHPDALARAVEALDGHPAALRGLCRTIQKHLEAGGRPGCAASGTRP